MLGDLQGIINPETHRLSGLALQQRCSRDNLVSMKDIAHTEADQVTPA